MVQTNANFSSRSQYRIELFTEAYAVSGGTRIDVSANLVKWQTVNNSPSSTGSPRSYSVPNGRANSTSGPLVETGGDSSLSFSFNFAAGQSFTIYSGFSRYIPSANGSTTVSISVSHSLLGSATASINVAQVVTVVNRTISFNGNGGDSPGSQTVSEGSSISLPSSSRSGYTFDYWIIGGSAYSAGQNYTVNSDVTATASWTQTYSNPSFTNGVSSGSFRVGDSVADYIDASNTFSDYGQSGTNYSALSIPISGLYVQDYGSYGYITGQVGNVSPGSYTVSVYANGPSGNPATSQGTYTILAALPSWSDTSVSSAARVGAYYSSNFSATNATSWTINGIPPGLTTSGTSFSTVTLSGTPTNSGSYTVSATPRNSGGESGSTEYFSITVSPRLPVWSDTTLATGARVGLAYSSTVSASYVNNWGVVGLPNMGLSFNAQTSENSFSTSTLSGTPTSFGTLTFSLTPRNSSYETTTTENYSITVYDASLIWSDQVLASSIVVQDEAYSDQVSVSAGPVSVTYSETPGFSLPSGLAIDSATGVISGSVATPGTYSFKMRATNGSSESIDTNVLSLTVEAAGGYVKVWNGSAWVDGTVSVRTGGTWVEGTAQIRSGGSWVTSFTS